MPTEKTNGVETRGAKANKARTGGKQKTWELYAITAGRQTGIYDNWATCQPLVDKFESCCFKGFNDFTSAVAYMEKAGVEAIDRRTCQPQQLTNLSSGDDSHEFSSDGEDTDDVSEASEGCDCKQEVTRLSALIRQLEERIVHLESATCVHNEQPSCEEDTSPSYADAVSTPPRNLQPRTLSQLPSQSAKSRGAANRRSTRQQPEQRAEFLPEKHLVIDLEKVPSTAANTELSLRAKLAKLNVHPKPVVTSLHFYNPHKPSVMVGFQTADMADAVLTEWVKDDTSFDGAMLRRPRERIPQALGMMRNVPLELGDAEVKELLDAKYAGAKATRLTNFRGPLYTVKVVFKNDADLTDAIQKGIRIEEFCLMIAVEPANDRPPRVTQCYKCYRLGHIARSCPAPEAICGNCGKGGHLARDCEEPTKCVNCRGPHRSGDHACGQYQQQLKKLISRRSPP